LTLFIYAIGLDTSSSNYFSVKEAVDCGIQIDKGDSEQMQALVPTVSQQVLNPPSCSYSSDVVATGFNGCDVTIKPQGDKSKTYKRTKDLRSGTEILLERQVDLFAQQLDVMKDIRAELQKRNNIEEQKLALKRARRD
jgi:hypothetical protein